MISEANDTAKKSGDAMVSEHARRAEYFLSGEVHKYRLKDTVCVLLHHKHVLSRQRQQSWYKPAVICIAGCSLGSPALFRAQTAGRAASPWKVVALPAGSCRAAACAA